LSVPLGGLSELDLENLANGFHKLHAQTYGHDALDEEIEVVNVRLSGFGALPDIEPTELEEGDGTPDAATASAYRNVWLPGDSDRTKVPIFQRDDLRVHNRVVGPAIIEEMGATTLLLSDQVMTVDKYGNLWMEENR
jgi:N-methylhydantoinase A